MANERAGHSASLSSGAMLVASNLAMIFAVLSGVLFFTNPDTDAFNTWYWKRMDQMPLLTCSFNLQHACAAPVRTNGFLFSIYTQKCRDGAQGAYIRCFAYLNRFSCGDYPLGNDER